MSTGQEHQNIEIWQFDEKFSYPKLIFVNEVQNKSRYKTIIFCFLFLNAKGTWLFFNQKIFKILIEILLTTSLKFPKIIDP